MNNELDVIIDGSPRDGYHWRLMDGDRIVASSADCFETGEQAWQAYLDAVKEIKGADVVIVDDTLH